MSSTFGRARASSSADERGMKAFVQLSGMNTPQFAVKQLGLRLDDENVRAPTRLGSCSAKRASSASALTHQSMCSLQRQIMVFAIVLVTPSPGSR